MSPTPQRSLPQQLQTNNMPTDHAENTNTQIREIYDSLISCRLFPEKQKGCCKGTRGTGDQQILKESNSRRKNLAIC